MLIDLDQREKQILFHIAEHGLSLQQRPFGQIAASLKMREEEVCALINELKKRGIIEELRAIVHHLKAGYTANALVAWSIPEGSPEALIAIFVDSDMTSHCYFREPDAAFAYNFFTMVHAKRHQEILAFAEKISRQFNLSYEILITEKELKKEKLDIFQIWENPSERREEDGCVLPRG